MKDAKQIAKEYVGKFALEGHAEFAITKAIEEDRASRHAVLSDEELDELAHANVFDGWTSWDYYKSGYRECEKHGRSFPSEADFNKFVDEHMSEGVACDPSPYDIYKWLKERVGAK